MDCRCSVCTVHMLLHLHGLHGAHKADIESSRLNLHLPFDVCIQNAREQHRLLRGYSCLQSVQPIHQHHTRHVAIHILLRHLCTFKHSSRTSGSASSNANSTLPVIIMCVLAFSPLDSAPSFRSHTPAQTSSCHPGCPSQSIQQGCN